MTDKLAAAIKTLREAREKAPVGKWSMKNTGAIRSDTYVPFGIPNLDAQLKDMCRGVPQIRGRSLMIDRLCLEKVHMLLVLRWGEIMLRIGGRLWRFKNTSIVSLVFSERRRLDCKVWQLGRFAVTYRFDGGKGKS